eukprot:168350-Chlamydomonas_euryale.AAC.7
MPAVNAGNAFDQRQAPAWTPHSLQAARPFAWSCMSLHGPHVPASPCMCLHDTCACMHVLDVHNVCACMIRMRLVGPAWACVRADNHGESPGHAWKMSHRNASWYAKTPSLRSLFFCGVWTCCPCKKKFPVTVTLTRDASLHACPGGSDHGIAQAKNPTWVCQSARCQFACIGRPSVRPADRRRAAEPAGRVACGWQGSAGSRPRPSHAFADSAFCATTSLRAVGERPAVDPGAARRDLLAAAARRRAGARDGRLSLKSDGEGACAWQRVVAREKDEGLRLASSFVHSRRSPGGRFRCRSIAASERWTTCPLPTLAAPTPNRRRRRRRRRRCHPRVRRYA